MGGGQSAPFDVVPILKKLQENAAKGDGKLAVAESSAKATDIQGMTYSELLAEVKKMSAKLRQIVGDKESPHVAYLINPSMRYVVCELSVWAAGCCAAVL